MTIKSVLTNEGNEDDGSSEVKTENVDKNNENGENSTKQEAVEIESVNDVAEN